MDCKATMMSPLVSVGPHSPQSSGNPCAVNQMPRPWRARFHGLLQSPGTFRPGSLVSRHRHARSRPGRSVAGEVEQLSAEPAQEQSSERQQAVTDDNVTTRILSSPDIEGDPLKFLKVSEAYWQVGPCPHTIALHGLCEVRLSALLTFTCCCRP